MRAGWIGLGAALALAACGETKAPAEPAAATVPPAAATPVAQPAVAPPAQAPDTKIGGLGMICGGETFQVTFEPGRAVIVGPDGATMDLKLLAPQPGAPQNVRTYTNGAMTFAREETPDGASVVRFARGRMAFQECVAAQG